MTNLRIPLITSFPLIMQNAMDYGNRDKLRRFGPLGSCADYMKKKMDFVFKLVGYCTSQIQGNIYWAILGNIDCIHSCPWATFPFKCIRFN